MRRKSCFSPSLLRCWMLFYFVLRFTLMSMALMEHLVYLMD
uniref:Uncharacterized protein n=1 Tax=Arundo donax TaxID=35708 RepID=A0A0A9FR80_ARUDO